MKSIFVRIFLLFTATLLVCFAGIELTNRVRNRFAPERRDFFSSSLSLQAQKRATPMIPAVKRRYANTLRVWNECFRGTTRWLISMALMYSPALTGAPTFGMLGLIGLRARRAAWCSRGLSQYGKYRILIDGPAPPGLGAPSLITFGSAPLP